MLTDDAEVNGQRRLEALVSDGVLGQEVVGDDVDGPAVAFAFSFSHRPPLPSLPPPPPIPTSSFSSSSSSSSSEPPSGYTPGPMVAEASVVSFEEVEEGGEGGGR